MTGTGTAVVPSEPDDVLSVKDGVVLAAETGTGTTVGPDEPVMVVDVREAPEAIVEGVVTDSAVSVDSSEFREDETPDNTLESPEASELETAGSVTVAATAVSSELIDAARLDNALDAAAVTLAPTEEPSAVRLEASLCAEELMTEAPLVAAPAADVIRLDNFSLGTTTDGPVVAGPVPETERLAPVVEAGA